MPARPDAHHPGGSGRAPPGDDDAIPSTGEDVPSPATRADAGAAPDTLADGGAPPSLLPDACAPIDASDVLVASCYAVSREPRSWSAALAACLDWGGSLVSINTPGEDAALGSLLSGSIWIGANDRAREGVMTWANADPFQFERFAAGEPDNTFGVQDCVERRADSTWNDRACSVSLFFACERPLAH